MITVANNNYKVVSQSKVKYIRPDSGRVGCSVGDILDKKISDNSIDLTTITTTRKYL